MLLCQKKPDKILNLSVEGGLQSLSRFIGVSPHMMKMWKDSSGRMHGVGLYLDDVLVFSETPTGVTWRRFRAEDEKTAAISGWSGADGSIEIRWVVKDSNRIRSARLPAR